MENTYKLKAKAYYAEDFDGSTDLFNACWAEYRHWINHCVDNPTDDLDVESALESIASAKVNNPRSRFYIYG